MTERSENRLHERVETASLFDLAGRRKYLSAEERARFVDAAATFSPEIEALCLLLHYTGCRISEALALRLVHQLCRECLLDQFVFDIFQLV